MPTIASAKSLVDRAEAAEREVERLRAALQAITDLRPDGRVRIAIRIARAALDAQEEREG